MVGGWWVGCLFVGGLVDWLVGWLVGYERFKKHASVQVKANANEACPSTSDHLLPASTVIHVANKDVSTSSQQQHPDTTSLAVLLQGPSQQPLSKESVALAPVEY